MTKTIENRLDRLVDAMKEGPQGQINRELFMCLQELLNELRVVKATLSQHMYGDNDDEIAS